MRKNIMHLFKSLGKKLGKGLEELTLTTNGSQLTRYAKDLFDSGVRRINISLDSLETKINLNGSPELGISIKLFKELWQQKKLD